jgi:hypothetical protein
MLQTQPALKFCLRAYFTSPEPVLQED